MMIDGVVIEAQEGINQEEISKIVIEEKEIWLQKGKELASIYLTIEDDEIVVMSKPKSTVKRVRRITGYLSTVDRFNDAKQSELSARVSHF